MGNVPKFQLHARAPSVADLIRNAGGRPFILGIGPHMSPRIRPRFLSFLLRSWSFPSGALTVATNRRKEIEVSNAFRVLRACTFCRSVAVSSSRILRNRDANAFAIIRRKSPRVSGLNIMSSLGICELPTLIPLQHWNIFWRRRWDARYNSVQLFSTDRETRDIPFCFGWECGIPSSCNIDRLQRREAWRSAGLSVWNALFVLFPSSLAHNSVCWYYDSKVLGFSDCFDRATSERKIFVSLCHSSRKNNLAFPFRQSPCHDDALSSVCLAPFSQTNSAHCR